MWTHLSTTYNMTINIYFISSEKNCAYLNSKISQDTILLTNSQMWRAGIPEFLDPGFPEHARTFLKIVNGDFIWNNSAIDFTTHLLTCSYCAHDGDKMCLCSTCKPTQTYNNFVASLFTEPAAWEDGDMEFLNWGLLKGSDLVSLPST